MLRRSIKAGLATSKNIKAKQTLACNARRTCRVVTRPRTSPSFAADVGVKRDAGNKEHGARVRPPLIPTRVVIDRHKGRKHFFLKKEAKTFGELARAAPQRQTFMKQKFFGSFFKKEQLAIYDFTPFSAAPSCANVKSGRYNARAVGTGTLAAG